MNRKGFLLQELLYVTVVLSIIFSVLIVIYFKYADIKKDTYKNLIDPHILLIDIQKNINNLEQIYTDKMIFNIDGCKLVYKIAEDDDKDDNNIFIYNYSSCELNVRNFELDDLKDAYFEDLGNNIYTLTIKKQGRKYPYVFYFYKKNYN